MQQQGTSVRAPGMKRLACVFFVLALAGCGADRQPVAPAPLPPADFEVSCLGASAARGCANSTCTVTSKNGFTGAVSLSCTGAPAGITCGFGPSQVTISPIAAAGAAFTVSADWRAADRAHTVEVAGTSGALRRSTMVPVSVGTVPRPTSRRMFVVGCAAYANDVSGANQAFRQVYVGAWRDTWGGRFCAQTLSEADGYFELEVGCFADSEPVYLTGGGVRSCAAPAYAAGSTIFATVIGSNANTCP